MTDGEWASVKMNFESQDVRSSAQKQMDPTLSLTSNLERVSLDSTVRWELNPSEIEIGKKLGEGAFGTVYRGKLRGKAVAIKKLHLQEFDGETLENFKAEVAVMSKLRHPNVVLFMGLCAQPGNYTIVTELMPRGSVFDILRDKSIELSFKRKMKMAKDAALGMNWLHCSTPVFIHRDLKTQNLLVDENWTVKVADFGLSHIKKNNSPGQKSSYGSIGTPLWMAPEVLQNKPYDESADVYSFGIVLWELYTREEPFKDFQNFASMVDSVVGQGKRPQIPEDCPKKLAKLITACWDADPAKRPTFTQIIPLFDGIIVDAIISDPVGSKMWKTYFLTDKLREKVSWRNFVIALTNTFKQKMPKDANDTRWKCLKVLLTDNDGNVSIEQFSRMLEWFGPLKELNTFLESVENLLRRPWFHGDISAQDAEKKLAEEKKGTFLIRFSSRDPGCYAVSVVSKGGKLKHFRVYHKPGLEYLIGNSECSSVEDIVTKFHKQLYLKYACPGSPFESIFHETTINSAGYLVPEI